MVVEDKVCDNDNLLFSVQKADFLFFFLLVSLLYTVALWGLQCLYCILEFWPGWSSSNTFENKNSTKEQPPSNSICCIYHPSILIDEHISLQIYQKPFKL